MPNFDLIIFDCDGVLVDSEMISCGLAAETYTALGYPVTPEEYIARFAGQSKMQILAQIDQEAGNHIFARFPHKEADAKLFKAFEERLKPVEYVPEVLAQLDLPMCIASGSIVERNTCALTVTGLLPYFEGRIFSASQVQNGKPAPDIFLYAAAQMGVDPAKCLVIEDSVTGIEAAKAAAMTVFGFMGGSHVNEAWRERVQKAGPDVMFDDMRELPRLMAQDNLFA